MERERKVNVSNMTNEQVDQLSDQIGEKVKQDVDSCVERVNKILRIYGMKAKMHIVFEKDE